ncbi:chromate efflux transporter [Vulcaniibacterium thermophilum]|uniref:Chromate transporter n=1 Tax=Vulcaniibacterium thermophilum TaxID=1169913 RepID=A0A918Z320_9GAMM|nr:chromate efflux transporter [Vulcaniibacterium thermophilum]GHE35729.1 chromate transporter [Vulcaniibacterium thermophilum]
MNSPTERPRFAEAVRFWLLLGCISFGGPAGQIAIMHAELVEKRRWVDEATFLRALDLCMLLPGPEAMQLATWLGWRLHGLRGGLIAGALFVLPAAVLLALLAWAYMRFGHLPVTAAVAFGLQAAVLGLIVHALQRIGTRVLRTPLAIALAVGALAALALLRWPFPWVLAGAALAGLAAWRFRPHWLPAGGLHGGGEGGQAGTRPSLARAALRAAVLTAVWWAPLLALAAWLGFDSTAWAMGRFFGQAALVTLGGAYAVLPYVAERAVHAQGWLDAGQMMTGLGLAETTPGPLILVLEFVGFVGAWQHPDLPSPLASAWLGAGVAVWATFLPSFLFVLTLAPWVERIARVGAAAAMLGAITAAVVGVIAQLALWFGARLLGGQDAVGAALVLGIAAATWWAVGIRRWPVYAVVPAAALLAAALQAAR